MQPVAPKTRVTVQRTEKLGAPIDPGKASINYKQAKGVWIPSHKKYNSGLFHFQKETGVSDAPETLTPRLTVDDQALKPILQSLYFEHGWLPHHIYDSGSALRRAGPADTV